MPARKPITLHRSHTGKAARAERLAAESALEPRTRLPMKPPTDLGGHPKAQVVWRRTLRMYAQVQTKIVNALDLGILVDYCLLLEELVDLEQLRIDAVHALTVVQANLRKLVSCPKKKDPKTVVAEQLAIAAKIDALMDAVARIDARSDRKRALIHTLRQSLYLTPRSRSGVSPAQKPKPEQDPMEQLLAEVESCEVRPASTGAAGPGW